MFHIFTNSVEYELQLGGCLLWLNKYGRELDGRAASQWRCWHICRNKEPMISWSQTDFIITLMLCCSTELSLCVQPWTNRIMYLLYRENNPSLPDVKLAEMRSSDFRHLHSSLMSSSVGEEKNSFTFHCQWVGPHYSAKTLKQNSSVPSWISQLPLTDNVWRFSNWRTTLFRFKAVILISIFSADLCPPFLPPSLHLISLPCVRNSSYNPLGRLLASAN